MTIMSEMVFGNNHDPSFQRAMRRAYAAGYAAARAEDVAALRARAETYYGHGVSTATARSEANGCADEIAARVYALRYARERGDTAGQLREALSKLAAAEQRAGDYAAAHLERSAKVAELQEQVDVLNTALNRTITRANNNMRRAETAEAALAAARAEALPYGREAPTQHTAETFQANITAAFENGRAAGYAECRADALAVLRERAEELRISAARAWHADMAMTSGVETIQAEAYDECADAIASLSPVGQGSAAAGGHALTGEGQQ